ncbi:MAG: CARDB domain-containing protein, partial [bacterium]
MALLTVAASNCAPATASVFVRNVDLPNLALAFAMPAVIEGASVNVTVSRDYALDQEVNVVLHRSDAARLDARLSVTIPSNQLGVTFVVTAIQNNLVEGLVTNQITARAIGFAPSTDSVTIVDDDLPSVVLSLDAASVSEGDGPMATRATVTRTPVTALPLVLDLTSSNPAKALVPATVVIPAGQASISFPVAAVDNLIVDGDTTVQLRVFIRASGSILDLAEGTGAVLMVRDDDGPTLSLTIARNVVPEGLNPATTGTVSRNTSTNAPLVVNLLSSNPGAATVPASVTIPAGAISVTFPIASVDDGVPSGNRSVVVTASATGYTSGLGSLVVSDIQLPDLVVTAITAPTNAPTDSYFTIGCRIENQGVAPAGPSMLTRFYLSGDPVIGNDVLLGENTFTGTLGPGQFYEQTMQFRLPSVAGNYWVVVTADADNRVNEIREDNNTAIQAAPLVVDAAYTAAVRASLHSGVVPTNVLLSGQAVLRGGGAAASVPVNIHLYLRGTHRVQQAITDLAGHFSTVFTPLPNEAGFYQVGAAHPGEPGAP